MKVILDGSCWGTFGWFCEAIFACEKFLFSFSTQIWLYKSTKSTLATSMWKVFLLISERVMVQMIDFDQMDDLNATGYMNNDWYIETHDSKCKVLLLLQVCY